MFRCCLLKTYLDSFVAISGNGLDLSHDAGASFYHGDRNDGAIWPEDLGHTDLPAQ